MLTGRRLFFVLILAPIVWFLIWFFGYFLAASIFFLPTTLVVVGTSYLLISRLSSKIALAFSLITILVCLAVWTTHFEENYCWKKGMELDPTGSTMVMATKEEAVALSDYNVTEGATISANFGAHMLCHQRFNFMEALKENYFR